jgi:hypothetical protein
LLPSPCASLLRCRCRYDYAKSLFALPAAPPFRRSPVHLALTGAAICEFIVMHVKSIQAICIDDDVFAGMKFASTLTLSLPIGCLT